MAFVPLRVLSSFSMLEGAIEPKVLAKTAAKRGFPAVALTAYARSEDREPVGLSHRPQVRRARPCHR